MTERMIQPERHRDPPRGENNSPRHVEGIRLLRRLGAGVTGTVYLAEDPVHGRVALKLLRRGMETSEGRRGFELEQRALALLDHPNIVRVLKAGTVAAARRYFVMEFVPGRTVVQHCDNEKLDLNARLRLFLQIGDALHHAKQRGIDYRVLKSENVLVTKRGRRALPKIIGFGMTPTLPGECSETNDHAGVYFMGVLLYELLVGVPPDSTGPRLFDMRRETERSPSSPAKLFLETADPEALACQRATSPLALLERLQGPLSRVARKCVAIDPLDGYATAGDLIVDVEDLLRCEQSPAGRGLRRARALLALRFRLNLPTADRV